LFVIIILYVYFVYISQGSAETHVRCSGMYNNHIIANCLMSVPVSPNRYDHFTEYKKVDSSLFFLYRPTCQIAAPFWWRMVSFDCTFSLNKYSGC